MEINIVDKDGFTNYCGSIIQNSEWEKELKEAHEAFKKEPTIQKYLEIKDKIASLRNRSFYNDEVKLLTENKAQERLNKIIKNIKEEEDIDRLKNLYGNKDERETLVGALYEILKDSSSFPWAECNRIFIALHPNLFCAIPFEANVNKLIALLEEKKYIKVTKSNQDLWIDKAHAVSDLFKNAEYEIKIGSYNENTNVTLPWQVFYALGGRTSDHGELLKNNRNLILTGAPGTGKTYLAKKIAAEMIGCDVEKLNNYEQFGFVQFHPSYDYTDFVEGLRPNDNVNGFERKDGIFKSFCAKAAVAEKEDNKKKEKRKYVFVIDEINRGEISKIFGELFFSIDPGYRGEKGKVDTQYQNLIKADEKMPDDTSKEYPFINGFYVPENVFIIGTMNDIDRSVESMDFAFRRRFAFYEVTADDSKQMLWDLNSWKSSSGDIEDAIKKGIPALDEKMKALNTEILKPKYGLSLAYQVGASYFLKWKHYYKNDDPFESLWKYHLEGLLFEYLRGKPNASELLKDLKNAYDKAK